MMQKCQKVAVDWNFFQKSRLSETLFATAPSVTTLRFACMVLIALRACCLSEAQGWRCSRLAPGYRALAPNGAAQGSSLILLPRPSGTRCRQACFSSSSSHPFISSSFHPLISRYTSHVSRLTSHVSIRRQKYNCFPKYLIPHSRNMFPLRVKYDGVAETGVVNVSYIVVCQ